MFTDYRVTGEQNILPSRLFWMLGNYSRFIRPGAQRVELEVEAGSVFGSAYVLRGDAGDVEMDRTRRERLVVVLANESAAPQSVQLYVDRRVERWVPHVTSDDDELAAQEAVAADRPYVLPARSVVTLAGR